MAFSPRAQPLERIDTPAPPLPGTRHRFRLPAVGSAAAEARRLVRRQLTEWHTSGETRDNAQLIVSELVTNALRHTGGHFIGCELRLLGGALRVAVSGEGCGPTRAPELPDDDDEGGRGLVLVVALSSSWGVRPGESGYGHVVWADLPLRPVGPLGLPD
ncbi:hypothetical protein GCM10027160_22650 [Streptomyces calidiresistens]|uniref:ATP-binding protein n=1 Tax=Streptomyces calidiresistens TaxID=1485586 RepID=UPI002B21FE63|nr:ATP-binding protein [Streptomyces calidiresistens]